MAWYDEVFDGAYDRFTFRVLTQERSKKEAEFIRTALQLRPGERVVDLACGYGRHAIPLARKGISIVGLDLKERYLEMAREEAGDLPVEFVQGDMRTLEWVNRFDAAYCYFTSFGFFDDNTNFDILRRIARSLRPGGRFLLDIQNREQYTSEEEVQREFIEFEEDGRNCVILNTSSFDPLRGVATVRLRLYGLRERPEVMEFSIRLYTLAELRWMMQRAGMEITEQFGDSDGSPYTLSSPRLITIARKRSQKEV